jgi:protein ImuB
VSVVVGVVWARTVARDALVLLVRDFSPRVECAGTGEVIFDASGLDRMFGDARTLAGEIRRTAATRDLQVRIALAGTRTAARLLIRHRAGLTIVEPGTEAEAVAPLPVRLLPALEPEGSAAADAAVRMTVTLRRWGLRTCGELAAVPAPMVAARLGQDGPRWQRLARGEDLRPMVPTVPEERFEQALDLEWPIEGLEPLSFVLGRLMEPLAAHLERRDRGVAVLHVRLHLVTREVYARTIEVASTMRDARMLRTLALLDLESHPPLAAIDRVVVTVDPAPARVVQFSLLTRPLPAPEAMATLLARVQAVMGEGRCGTPALPDTWAPGACAVVPFAPSALADAPVTVPPRVPAVALRRFRHPVAVRVRTADGRPVHVLTDRRHLPGGAVVTSAGPWRTSGGWWTEGWDRDEWEVTLRDGTSCRLFREREHDRWFVDARID